ncbi:hypothetical protein [Elizabethkingia anophelis]|uniref:META domain-containing protein n=1 Tax=Elizabethkingia anophelis TaxID=1117645 RepID=A0A7Z7PW09_9FLAO|nr:hypothetical protein [Elizabethkingia anophelis]AQW91682.1 hypothetical protein BBD28_13965 [Elizabethkingia anophelis]AVF48436.1 hypothetical protein AL491_10295 [Elizabethkingia anophelis]AVF52431.1 hypothetical protein AL492_12705 [Elizabethkingia anophelis]KUY18427.1 hypothetical protein ATB94_02935 [Elizabethkingia anophelis]MBG0506075.1 hypothetical protein [Elizabethkingia anophelis]
MNKFIISYFLIIMAMLPVVYAQNNPFIKTTWKIDHIAPNGKAILVKAKWINLSNERAKFHFIQFEDNFKYQTGISCYNALGLYRVRENNIIELSTSDGAMSPDCEEPKNLSGSYYFKENNNTIELAPLYEEATSTIDAIAIKADVPEIKYFPANKAKQKIKRKLKHKKIAR